MEVKIKIPAERLKSLGTEKTTFRSAYDFELTEKDLQLAKSELGETEEIRKTCIEKLKKMLRENTDRRYRTDDDYLLRFLRWRKFDCNKAYSTIKKFNDLKFKNPDFFSLPSNFDQLLSMDAIKCLPYRDEKGSIIYYVDTKKWDLEHMSFCNLMQVSNAVADILSMNPSSQINSIIGLWDLGGFTARHFWQCISPATVKIMIQSLQDSHPWRIRRLICFNSSVIVRTVYRMTTAKLSKKIADRMKFLGSDVKEIHKYINPAILPKDYGGAIEDSECSVKELVLDNLKYLEYEHSFF